MKKSPKPKPKKDLSISPVTVEQFSNYIVPGFWDKENLLTWPPDVFALVAAILQKSGAYVHAVSGWKRNKPIEEWTKFIKDVGVRWRNNLSDPPDEVREWHRMLLKKDVRNLCILEVPRDPALCSALLHLSAAADEACVGVGFWKSKPNDRFLHESAMRLFLSGQRFGVSTLAHRVDRATVQVLPKLHTPQSGITIRSLTHNLALCPAGDVRVRWVENPCAQRHYFNLLIMPWPLSSNPSHFRDVEPSKAELRDMPSGFGFFEYDPRTPNDPVVTLKKLLQQARRTVNKIHGVVLPELALSTMEYEKIKATLIKEDIFLVCGVRERPSVRGRAGKNYLRFDMPAEIPNLGKQLVSHQQSKHHRWRLDKRQIVQYGLGSCLDVKSQWWEHISIGNRELYFVVLDDWLTVCTLICEDLARQDPVSDIVRSVGPNLVIALLMDGPQLNSRWSARYATVLADDPGSSVLTLTSLGMSELCRPPAGYPRSRAVALWKDAKSGEATHIEIPQHADGVILSLSRERENEWSADGRNDHGMAGYPMLSGVHYVSLGNSIMKRS
jgi:hypothetical protein